VSEGVWMALRSVSASIGGRYKRVLISAPKDDVEVERADSCGLCDASVTIGVAGRYGVMLLGFRQGIWQLRWTQNSVTAGL
jgi:hypothetical protein